MERFVGSISSVLAVIFVLTSTILAYPINTYAAQGVTPSAHIDSSRSATNLWIFTAPRLLESLLPRPTPRAL